MKEIVSIAYLTEAKPYPFARVGLSNHRTWLITGHAVISDRMEQIPSGVIKEVVITKMDSNYLVTLNLLGDIDSYDLGYTKEQLLAEQVASVINKLLWPQPLIG
jgi:hypothetical protein